MSVYLDGTSVLLDTGKVATDAACCCGPSCCPFFAPYTAIHFSGQVIGCAGGTINLPEKIWTHVASAPGCNIDVFEFATDSNCGCVFQAQNCTLNEVGYIEIDEIGDCNDPNTYFGCIALAHISCDGTVTFEAFTGPNQCCDVSAGLNAVGPYALPGPIDLTFTADIGDPSIQFRFILSVV